MSQEQPPKPVTYGDVFPVHGDLASQPITSEDASLMESAETLALGHTQKGGVAAVMQSAAHQNLEMGFIDKEAHTPVADQGVTVIEMVLPGKVVHTEFVAGQPIMVSSEPSPTIPGIAAQQDAVTIGEALEAAAVGAGDQPVEASDARAIQSAEKRATGMPVTGKGGLTATAQAAAELNPRVDDYAKTTLSDVLADASSHLAADKAVTREDAEKIAEAERRGRPFGDVREGGVGAAVLAAGELNERGVALSAAEYQMQQLTVEDVQNVVTTMVPVELSPAVEDLQNAVSMGPVEVPLAVEDLRNAATTTGPAEVPVVVEDLRNAAKTTGPAEVPVAVEDLRSAETTTGPVEVPCTVDLRSAGMTTGPVEVPVTIVDVQNPATAMGLDL